VTKEDGMKRLLMLGLALALIVPATAAAKGEIDTGSVAICGPSDCDPFDHEASLRWLSGLMYAESPSAAQPPPASSYYELRWTDEGLGGGALSLGWVVPGHDMIATERLVGSGGVRWFRLAGGIAGALSTATAGIEPYPAPELARVYVGDREAADAAPYLMLLGPLEPKREAADPEIPLGLVTSEPTPWTMPSSYAELWYSPEEDAVLVDGTWYRMPTDLAGRVETDAGLPGSAPSVPPAAPAPTPVPAPAAATGTGFPWALVAGLAAGAALLLGVLAVTRRLRTTGRGGGTQPA
jgi:hypothetical protein